MKRVYQISFVMILFITLLLIYYYFSTPKPSETSSAIEEFGDTIIENVTARTFNENGQLSTIIVTPTLVNNSQNDTSYFSQPRITLFRGDGQPWEIQSVYGRSEEGTKRIIFWEDVIIHQNQGINNVETTIKTSQLTHYPDTNTAETDQFITMEQPGIYIESIGMFADLNTEMINLLSDTRGRYEKNN